MTSKTSVLLFAMLSCVAPLGISHDIDGPSNYQWSPERMAYPPIDRVAQGALPSNSNTHLFYVVVLPNRWAQQQQIHVCFNGGSSDLRNRILDVAGQWFTHTNLTLVRGGPLGANCVPQDKSEIRIGFSEPGYWSYIGTDGTADYLVSRSMSSMNFQGFDVAPPGNPELSGLVLHEFGHALGLHHEHQSPAGGCDTEYDWVKLYKYYDQTYHWTKEMVDANLKPLLADRSAFEWSDSVDPNSIMIYASNPAFLKSGTHSKCYFHGNKLLSAGDIQGIENIAYPKSGASLMLKVQAQSLQSVIDSGTTLNGGAKEALSRQLELSKKQLGGK